MRSYIVVGMGRFGSEVARQLHQLRCEVIAMDVNDELIQQISFMDRMDFHTVNACILA